VWLSPLFCELNLVAAHAVLDDRERIVERGDAFAGDLLEKELRLFSAGSAWLNRFPRTTSGVLPVLSGCVLPRVGCDGGSALSHSSVGFVIVTIAPLSIALF
jgi:hypothetical protein